MQTICGIYGIRHIESGRVYVGQSIDVNRRFTEHKSELRNDKHYNLYLQRAWNKYGELAFSFIVLEECNELSLPIRENYWISTNETFNLILDVTTRCGKSNPNYGKKNTIETRIKMSEGRSKKLTADIVCQIKSFLQEDILSQQEIADLFNIGRTTVTRIASGARWTNVTGGATFTKRFRQTHRDRIGQKRLGKKHSEASKEKMRRAKLGTKHSEETKNKMSLAHKRKREV